MAIAYFIPDQHKLLAASAGNSNYNNNNGSSVSANNSNNNATTSQSSSPPTSTSGTSPSVHQQPPSNQSHSQFRANISIPISLSTSETNVGCWDLIAQIFCYALRFYHEARLSPGVLEISLEINNGTRVQPTANQQTSTSESAAAQSNTSSSEHGVSSPNKEK